MQTWPNADLGVHRSIEPETTCRRCWVAMEINDMGDDLPWIQVSIQCNNAQWEQSKQQINGSQSAVSSKETV